MRYIPERAPPIEGLSPGFVSFQKVQPNRNGSKRILRIARKDQLSAAAAFVLESLEGVRLLRSEAHQGTAQLTPLANAPTFQCSKEGDCILLAEDSGDDLILMRYAFRKAGVKNRVSEVRDGQEAIEYLEGVGPCADRDKHPLPCIIITDLKMPRLDGFAFLKWLQARPEFSRVPKLVLSASGIEKDRRRAGDLGACGYFVKPGGFDELVRVVAEIDDNWISEHCPLSKAA